MQLAVSVGRHHSQVSGVVVERVAVHVMHVLAIPYSHQTPFGKLLSVGVTRVPSGFALGCVLITPCTDGVIAFHFAVHHCVPVLPPERRRARAGDHAHFWVDYVAVRSTFNFPIGDVSPSAPLQKERSRSGSPLFLPVSL